LNSKILIAVVLASVSVALKTQGQTDFSPRAIFKGVAVQFLFPEQVNLPSSKPSIVTLHFRIAQGLHINSHAPRQDYLIPTEFSIPDGAGVRLEGASYPPGADLTLAIDPNTKLSVYTGEFAIQARIVATPGDHLVEAKLRFQACDKNECMPPKTIPVAIDVIGN
jgi:hypothetical protein